jgi:hypothetical protein
MGLREDDERYLNEKGLQWSLTAGQGGEHHLVLSDLGLQPGKYNRLNTNLLILIPSGYDSTPLDMYYVEPWIKLANGTHPPAADVPYEALGRTWQRFSRHLPTWRPGVDGIPTLLRFALRELQAP